ncbi:unnamed protein product [Mytilus coruscus]|uniref:Uncharacterized protein n=1 Tax=Mytilus coruscus TaxID=42192 RepID=A0A6J8AKJ0_MYTCO|nr:unnamed protein product [Mytilus coruscus]
MKSVYNYELYLQLNPSIIALMNEDWLGKISAKTSTISLPFKEAKADQAKVQLRMPDMKNINNVRLQFKKRFEVKQKGFLKYQLSGCTMLINGNWLMANDLGNAVLMEYSEDGKHIRDIPCSGRPFDMTVIDTERIAITYGYRKYVEILNMKNNTVQMSVTFKHYCFGISYQDN